MKKQLPIEILEQDLLIQPIELSETIPSTWYTNKNIFDIEQDLFFNKHYQYAGHTTQIPNVGDYFLFEINDKPLIVVKVEGNSYKAYFNVCRHRGGPLALDNGNCKLFQCKYHGWTYKLDGSLRGAPKFDDVKNFNKSEFGLFLVNLVVWQNLIFVCLSEEIISINFLTKGISEKIFPIRISEKSFYKRVRYILNCNWKVYVDNYLEGYHLPYVHPGLSKLLVTQKYETELNDFNSLQYSPLQKEENFYGEGNAYYYFLFPNMMMNILPGRLQMNIVLPVSVDKTMVIFDYYYDDIFSPDSLIKIKEDINYSDQIQREDIMICEKVQKGLKSGIYHKGRFSVESEKAVYHFQSLLKKSIAENN